jgi:hypothetical protein
MSQDKNRFFDVELIFEINLRKRVFMKSSKFNLLVMASLFLATPAFAADIQFESNDAVPGVHPIGNRDVDVNQGVIDAINGDQDIGSLVSDVTVSTHDGIVTLTGSVTENRTKIDVEFIAKGIGGVKGVVNRIQVKSSPSSR